MNDQLQVENNLTPPMKVFYPGYDHSSAYRIPSMITTLEGTIIAGIDARIESERDNPNKIVTKIRRSTDDGRTWEPAQTLIKYPGQGLDGAAAIDTALLQDQMTGTIWLLVLHTPGGVGLWNSELGTGFNAEGKKLLYDLNNDRYYLARDGVVYTAEGKKTYYTLDHKGNVFYGDKQKGNIYLKKGIDPNESLLESRTSFLQIIKSNDDGLTWSQPIDLNPEVKESWMRFIGAGPGRGIQLTSKAYKNRLIFPIYFSNKYGRMSCAVIYSDDHGQTWKRSASPNDQRVFKDQLINAYSLKEKEGELTESQLVELPNGTLHLYMRNHSKLKRTARSESFDGGETWSEPKFIDALINPTCQSSVIKYPAKNSSKTKIIYANPADDKYRQNGTIRLSEDGGKTWPYAKSLGNDTFMYSCLTILSDGRIGLLYESSLEKEDFSMDINFITFTLDWLKS